MDKARQRFRELPNTPGFNTQLSFVSIVGGRGVGKSTVASLLSGNSSMFTVNMLNDAIMNDKDHQFHFFIKTGW